MHYLYILKSSAATRHYIGITGDIENRLAKHNSGSVTSTKAYRPWQLVYTESFVDKMAARKREIFLKKTNKARKELFDKIDKASSSNG